MKCTARKLSHRLFGILIVLGSHIPLHGAQATTIVPQVHNGSTVWTGSDPLALDAAQIGSIVGAAGLGLFYDAHLGKARLASSGAADGQVVFTAVQNGIAGHDIAVEIVNSGAANSPLSVSVIGSTIRITLATDASGAVTSTATQVAAAVSAHPTAFGLVVASAGGSGTGLVQTLSATPLAPVIVETGSFASAYQTVFANSASFPQDASVAYGSGAAIVASALYLYVRDTGTRPRSTSTIWSRRRSAGTGSRT